jgi:hypothetical protein
MGSGRSQCISNFLLTTCRLALEFRAQSQTVSAPVLQDKRLSEPHVTQNYVQLADND